MDFVPFVAAIALIWKIVDFAKACRVRDVDAIVTQLATWGAGVAVMYLLAATDFAGQVMIGDARLDALNAASVALVGLSVGSTASAAYDFKRAVDRSDSAAQPSLVTGRVPVTPPVTVDSDAPARDARLGDHGIDPDGIVPPVAPGHTGTP